MNKANTSIPAAADLNFSHLILLSSLKATDINRTHQPSLPSILANESNCFSSAFINLVAHISAIIKPPNTTKPADALRNSLNSIVPNIFAVTAINNRHKPNFPNIESKPTNAVPLRPINFEARNTRVKNARKPPKPAPALAKPSHSIPLSIFIAWAMRTIIMPKANNVPPFNTLPILSLNLSSASLFTILYMTNSNPVSTVMTPTAFQILPGSINVNAMIHATKIAIAFAILTKPAVFITNDADLDSLLIAFLNTVIVPAKL